MLAIFKKNIVCISHISEVHFSYLARCTNFSGIIIRICITWWWLRHTLQFIWPRDIALDGKVQDTDGPEPLVNWSTTASSMFSRACSNHVTGVLFVHTRVGSCLT